MGDTTDAAGAGTTMLLGRAIHNMKWEDVFVENDEVNLAEASKDAEEARGKRLCTPATTPRTCASTATGRISMAGGQRSRASPDAHHPVESAQPAGPGRRSHLCGIRLHSPRRSRTMDACLRGGAWGFDEAVVVLGPWFLGLAASGVPRRNADVR
jgi:hypothetical protein